VQTNQYDRCPGRISGLQVRVLPGSPSLFKELASLGSSLKKNCAPFCAHLGFNPRSTESINRPSFRFHANVVIPFHHRSGYVASQGAIGVVGHLGIDDAKR
jgi:hypothetical protein